MDNPYSEVHRDPSHKSNFTILNNKVLTDYGISYHARYLLAWLLSHNPKEDFKFTAEKISKRINMPLSRTRSAIKELQAAGYLKLTRRRNGQRYDFFRWDIYESPIADNEPESCTTNNIIIPEEQPVVITEEEFTFRQLFDQFWSVYPKQLDEEQAYKAFCQIPNLSEVFPQIMAALNIQLSSKQWKEDNGRFIPCPEKYIKQTRWAEVVIPDPEAEAESISRMMRILR